MRFRRPVPVRFVVAGVLLLLVQWWFIGLTLMREGGSPMREGGSLMWREDPCRGQGALFLFLSLVAQCTIKWVPAHFKFNLHPTPLAATRNESSG